MADYKESVIAGTSWTRATRLVIENPLNLPELREEGIPSLMIVEEEVINTGTKAIKTICGNLSCQFDITDPDDLALYELLDKKYVKLRGIRDTPPVVESVIEEPVV